MILESFFNRARHTIAVDEDASLQEVLTSQVLSLVRLFRYRVMLRGRLRPQAADELGTLVASAGARWPAIAFGGR